MAAYNPKDREVPSRLIPIPESFGSDPLSAFLQTANDNVVASYVNQAEWFKRFLDLDTALRSVHDAAPPLEVPPRLLLSRAIASFRASCRAAMSGCPVEASISIRATLEAALYGLHISVDTANFEAWVSRNDSEDSLDTCKKTFLYRKVQATLRQRNSELSTIAESIYEDSIDFGAHPNQQAIFGDLTLTRSETAVEILLHHIVSSESNSYQLAMLSTARVGLCVLLISLEIFPSRKTAEVTEVIERLQTELYSPQSA